MESAAVKLFKSHFGTDPAVCSQIAGSGSPRSYYRLESADGLSVIATEGTSVDENEAFFYLRNALSRAGIPVPEIIAVSPDRLTYLQEDLGDTSLFSLLHTPGADRPLHRAIALLSRIHHCASANIDFSRCYPVSAMDHRSVMWDLNYFKYSFLKVTGLEFDEAALETDMENLASEILREAETGGVFMYRDFQSRNVMVRADGSPVFIDFQGGRKGPALYDLASFLWQAKARFSDEQRRELARVYYDEAARLVEMPATDEFFRQLYIMALFRTVQVLGAYGFRGLIQKKPHFITSIAPALANLEDLLGRISLSAYPELSRVLHSLVLIKESFSAPAGNSLMVTVNSFGFLKSGIPADFSGNGGGFVFDCRAATNPGRFDRYKSLTGRDPEVMEFLEEAAEIPRMLENVKAIVGPAVERYIRRGFSNLMISFGCTGGQHRSVYSAEKIARWINSAYGVAVTLRHIEQGITEYLPAE